MEKAEKDMGGVEQGKVRRRERERRRRRKRETEVNRRFREIGDNMRHRY